MMLARTLLAIALGLTLNAEAAVSELDRGIQAFASGDYQDAYALFSPLAVDNDREALYYLGLMFRDGKGVARQPDKALFWLLRAAEQEHAGAQAAVALMYETGNGVARDYREAAAWMKKSAENGDPDAQFMLSEYYREGIGVVQDFGAAYDWNLRSVSSSRSHEQLRSGLFALGHTFEWGQGVQQSLVEAYRWYSLAAAYSVDDARLHRLAVRATDALSTRMNAAEIRAAQAAAEAWRSAAATGS